MAKQAAPVAARAMRCTAGRGSSQDRQPFTVAGSAANVMAADRQICAAQHSLHQPFKEVYWGNFDQQRLGSALSKGPCTFVGWCLQETLAPCCFQGSQSSLSVPTRG